MFDILRFNISNGCLLQQGKRLNQKPRNKRTCERRSESNTYQVSASVAVNRDDCSAVVSTQVCSGTVLGSSPDLILACQTLLLFEDF